MSSAMNRKETDALVAEMTANQSATDPEVVRRLFSTAKLVEMPIEKLAPNPNNPRESVDFDDITQSLRQRGFDKSFPFVANSDGQLWRGHRRLSAIQYLRDNPEVSQDVYDTIIPGGTVPVLVIDTDNPDIADALLYDHSKSLDRKGLNDWELLGTVVRMVAEDRAHPVSVANLHGKSRTWGQKFVALAMMPQYVRDAFRPVLLGGKENLDSTPLRSQDVLVVARDRSAMTPGDFQKHFREKWLTGTAPGSQAVLKGNSGGSTDGDDSLDFKALRNAVETLPRPLADIVAKCDNAAAFRLALVDHFRKVKGGKQTGPTSSAS